MYQSGQRFSPRLARFGNTLVASHSWLMNPSDPASRWVCVLEGLDLQGNLLWTRSEAAPDSNVFCREGSESGASFLHTMVVRAPAGPAIRVLTVDAGGNLTRSNDVVPQGGAATSPSLVLPTPSGWRVIRSCDHHRPRIRRASLRRSSRDSRTGHLATRGWRHRTDAVLRRLSHASSSSTRSRCRSHQSVGA